MNIVLDLMKSIENSGDDATTDIFSPQQYP